MSGYGKMCLQGPAVSECLALNKKANSLASQKIWSNKSNELSRLQTASGKRTTIASEKLHKIKDKQQPKLP